MYLLRTFNHSTGSSCSTYNFGTFISIKSSCTKQIDGDTQTLQLADKYMRQRRSIENERWSIFKLKYCLKASRRGLTGLIGIGWLVSACAAELTLVRLLAMFCIQKSARKYSLLEEMDVSARSSLF